MDNLTDGMTLIPTAADTHELTLQRDASEVPRAGWLKCANTSDLKRDSEIDDESREGRVGEIFVSQLFSYRTQRVTVMRTNQTHPENPGFTQPCVLCNTSLHWL